MDNKDLIWAAGFIDGEGCISIIQDRGRYTASINVGQVSPRPLQELQKILGGAVGPVHDAFGGHYQWRVYSDKAAGVAEKLLPYLRNKEEQAMFLLRFQGTKGSTGKRVNAETDKYQTYLFEHVKKLNKRRKRIQPDAERLSETAPALRRKMR